MPDRPPTFDHLSKKPLEQRVTVYLDDEPIAALAEAREALADAEIEANGRYDKRLALVRQAGPTASEVLTAEAGLDADRQTFLAPYRDAVAAAEDAVRAASRVFVLRSPRIERDGKPMRGRRAFEQLIAEHPPTGADHDDTRKMTGRPEAQARWHSDTFIPALIAACCVDPEISVEQAVEMYEEWTDGEIGELTSAALTVSQGARQVDLGKASRAATTRD